MVWTGDEDAAKCGLINAKGEEVVPCRYDYINVESDGLAEVKIGDDETGKYGLVDIKTGKEVVPCKYESLSYLSEGLAEVRIGDDETGKYGVVEASSGKEIIPCKCDMIMGFSDGVITAVINDEYVRFNTKGEVVNSNGE